MSHAQTAQEVEVRHRIVTFLADNPCATVAGLLKTTRASVGYVQWVLLILIAEGVIDAYLSEETRLLFRLRSPQ